MSNQNRAKHHLSSPLRDQERITLEEAIEAYKIWARNTQALVESDDQSITHKGFEDLLNEVRNADMEMSSVVLSRLVERFASIESHILNDEEIRNLIKRYPQIIFEQDWEHVDVETVDGSIDLIFKSNEGDSILLVETAFETDARKSLGNLLYEREHFEELVTDEVKMCLVALDADDYLRGACDMSGVVLLELGPTALINRIEKSAEWGNLRGLTLTP